MGSCIDLREAVLNQSDVGHRVFARTTGNAAGHAYPGPHLVRPVAFDLDRAVGHGLGIGRAPVIHPDDGVHQGLAGPVHGHGAGPLGRHPQGQDAFHGDQPPAQQAAGGGHDGPPPQGRILLHAAAGQEDHRGRLALHPQEAARQIHQGHLGAGGAQVDGQDGRGRRGRWIEKARWVHGIAWR